MRKRLSSLLFASTILALPTQGYAQSAFDGLFPGAKTHLTGEVSKGGGATAEHILVEAVAFELALEKPQLETLAGQGARLSYERATFYPKSESAKAIELSGGSLVLSGMPDSADACSWMSVVKSAEFSRALLSDIRHDQIAKKSGSQNHEQTDGTTSGRVDLLNGSFQQSGSDICGISGVISIGTATMKGAKGSKITGQDLTVQVIMPLRPTMPEMPVKSALRIKAGELEYSYMDEIPVASIHDVNVRADFDTPSLAGFAKVAELTPVWTSDVDPLTLTLQAYNAATMSRGAISVESRLLRIFAPGAVPSEAVANFSRVGLSTITGTFAGHLAFSKGDVRLKSDMDLTGVAKISIEQRSRLAPYRDEVFKAIRAGHRSGAFLLPDWRLQDTRLVFQDTGLDRAVEDLTTVPSARYADEMLGNMIHLQDESYKTISSFLKESFVGFLRKIPAGDPVEVSVQPEREISIPEIILMGIRDMPGLVEFLRVEQKVNLKS